MPTVLRTERRPGATPGRFRHIKIIACECGGEVACESPTGSPCACGRVYDRNGWQIASTPKERE